MMNRTNRKTRIRLTCKWFVLSIVLILANTISLMGGADKAKPLLLIPIVMSISMWENELVAGIVGAISGLMIDMSSAKLLGFNAVFLLITATLTALICLHFMRRNLINLVALTIVATIIHGLLDFFFYFAMWSYNNYLVVFFERTVPSAIYTVIASPVVYLIIKFIMNKFTEPERIVVEENIYTEEDKDIKY